MTKLTNDQIIEECINSEVGALKDSERTRCEVWTRVMGYHRPVSLWNKGKVSEYNDRVTFNVPE